MTVRIPHQKLTVGQYHQMIASGVLTDRDRVELIEGDIIERPLVNQRHAACVDRLTELFVLQLASRAIVRTQNPICLSDNSEPQPDIALLRRRDDFYETGHPEPEDIFLVIEVADTTIEFDRAIKIPVYAAAGITEAWLIDLNTQQVEVFQQPTLNAYQCTEQFSRGQALSISAFPEVRFDVAQLLG